MNEQSEGLNREKKWDRWGVSEVVAKPVHAASLVLVDQWRSLSILSWQKLAGSQDQGWTDLDLKPHTTSQASQQSKACEDATEIEDSLIWRISNSLTKDLPL